MQFSNQSGVVIISALIQVIHSNRDYLSKIDGAIGDGDHGVNMDKGFTLVEQALDLKTMNMSSGFNLISKTLINKIGGSMGPLYGYFFKGLTEASSKQEQIDKLTFLTMLERAYINIKELTTAEVGDKTLIDVLTPALLNYKKAIDDGQTFDKALLAMIAAAKHGLESTKNMVAKVGRAHRLGDKSVGHLDAGAASCDLILSTIANTAIQLMVTK